MYALFTMLYNLSNFLIFNIYVHLNMQAFTLYLQHQMNIQMFLLSFMYIFHGLDMIKQCFPHIINNVCTFKTLPIMKGMQTLFFMFYEMIVQMFMLSFICIFCTFSNFLLLTFLLFSMCFRCDIQGAILLLKLL